MNKEVGMQLNGIIGSLMQTIYIQDNKDEEMYFELLCLNYKRKLNNKHLQPCNSVKYSYYLELLINNKSNAIGRIGDWLFDCKTEAYYKSSKIKKAKSKERKPRKKDQYKKIMKETGCNITTSKRSIKFNSEEERKRMTMNFYR